MSDDKEVKYSYSVFFKVEGHPLFTGEMQEITATAKQYDLLQGFRAGLHLYNEGTDEAPELDLPGTALELKQAPIYVPFHKIELVLKNDLQDRE